jgi:hypothetical protein
LGVQTPPLAQKWPAAHWFSLVQLPVTQALVEAQAISPGQGVAPPAPQVRLLLQVLLVIMEVVELHDGVPHSSPTAARYRHAPDPLQVPSWPQGSLTAAHTPRGSALFAVTAMHEPVVVVSCPFKAAVQAVQTSAHALSQHTPSAISPEVHSYSRPLVAAVPFGFLVTQMPAVVSQ